MASISWQGLTGYVRQFVAAVQASANAAVDASEGSITLAFGEAISGAAVWLQAQIATVLGLTRASTSFGIDLDTWMADWFFERVSGVEASTTETFSRFTPTNRAVVPVGALVSTGPGGAQFIVITDLSNPNYSILFGGYVAGPSVASVTVPVMATIAGTSGNVLANTITSFVQPIVGFDTCTNASAVTNGSDAEGDASFLARFRDYIQSLRKGTVLAIRFAILSLKANLTCEIIENKQPDLSTDNGFLTIVIDDGTGSPPSDLLNAAGAAISDDVRAAGIRYCTIGPTIVHVTIALTVSSIESSKHAADISAVHDAIMAYVNGLPTGATLVWARLYQLAFDASENISEVSGITIDSGTSDIVPTAVQIIKTSSVTVS